MTAPRLPDLSQAVVTYLNTQFSGQFTATHNSNVVYKLPDLATIKVDVWPASLDRSQRVRAGWSRQPTLNIAIQKRASDQTAMDTLTNLVDDILDSILGQRFATVWYCNGGSFSNEIFDRFEKYEENVFQSVIVASFEKPV